MPKQLPNVMNDIGYQKDAHDFAKKIMECKGILGPCKDMNHFQEWMEEALSKAYLYGAQSAVRVGYLLADKDWEQRRYEIAKECVAVLMRNEITLEDAAKISVEQADALIAELKKLPAITEAKLQVVDKVYPMSFEQNRLELHNLEVRIKVSQ